MVSSAHCLGNRCKSVYPSWAQHCPIVTLKGGGGGACIVQWMRTLCWHVCCRPKMKVMVLYPCLQIVDSIMALFRVDFSGRGELADRQQKLAQLLSRLQKISEGMWKWAKKFNSLGNLLSISTCFSSFLFLFFFLFFFFWWKKWGNLHILVHFRIIKCKGLMS